MSNTFLPEMMIPDVRDGSEPEMTGGDLNVRYYPANRHSANARSGHAGNSMSSASKRTESAITKNAKLLKPINVIWVVQSPL
jgi:hypothetical protein